MLARKTEFRNDETPFFMTASEQTEQVTLSADALATLGISKQPFDTDVKTDALFSNDALQELLDELHTILNSSEQLPVITGARGAGKSSLLSLLISKTNESVQYFIVEGNQHFSAYNVFAGMLEAFQVSAPEDLQECLDELATRLRTLEEQNLQAVILVDDAHQVTPSELYKLISGMLYMRDGSKLDSFRIALTATEEFAENIIQIIPADIDLNYTTLTLPRLELQDTTDFIDQRLRNAGYFQPLPLDKEHLQEIRRNANGLPGSTCTEATKALNELFRKPTTKAADEPGRASIIETVTNRINQTAANPFNKNYLLAGLAGVFILLAAYLFLGDSEQTEPLAEQEVKTITLSEPLQPVEPAAGGPSRLVLLSELNSHNNPATTLPGTLENRPSPPTLPRIQNPAPAPQAQAKAVVQAPIETVQPPPKPVVIKAEEKPPAKPEPATPPKPEPAAKPETPAKAEKPADKANAEQQASAAAEQTEADNDELQLQSANWVLMQNPTQFTVQMIASSNRDEVERFLKTHDLAGPNSIFSFKRGEETWYALVHGLYSDIEDAQQAIRELPDEVRTRHPWIRQIKRIHESLKSNA
ncbi:MAG: AAA family ATPase [Gammaproteobacteria bacterium]|nr:AAA family ATPase [Gammaproteobacteria bacterium]